MQYVYKKCVVVGWKGEGMVQWGSTVYKKKSICFKKFPHKKKKTSSLFHR